MALRCGKLFDSMRSIPACHGLGISGACVEYHFPEPERFGLGRLAGLAVEHRLAEVDLGVVGVNPQALGTRAQRRWQVSEHLVAAGDQGVEFAHDRIGGGRSAQAVLEMAQGGRLVLAIDGDRAQVEEHERVIGPLGQLGFEDLAIALELALPQCRVGVAGVPDREIGPAHRHIRPPQRRQDLLVHRVRPAHTLPHRKQPDMVHHRLPAVAVRPRIARAADHIGGLVAGPQTVEQRLELDSLGRIKQVIGIKLERIILIVPNGTERQTTLRKRFVTVGINAE